MIIHLFPDFNIDKIVLKTFGDELDKESKKYILDNLELNLFTNLVEFDCSFCNLKKLPNLPNSLKILKCYNNKLELLPEILPDTLEILECWNNKISKLPDLPDTLIEIECSRNSLIELPKFFPSFLCKLNCSSNKLTKISKYLPITLTHLNFSKNFLIYMPKLPKSLTHLNCGANNLNKITNSFYGQYELPKTLELLWFYGNNFKELPDLHNSLTLINHNVMINYNKSCNDLDLIYPNYKIKTINETNLKNRIIKRMKLLNRTLLLEHSAVICMNPKRIERLLDNNEIDFFDGSFSDI